MILWPHRIFLVLKIRQMLDVRPSYFRRRAQSFEDPQDGANLGVSIEEGAPDSHLGNDATDAPHVK